MIGEPFWCLSIIHALKACTINSFNMWSLEWSLEWSLRGFFAKRPSSSRLSIYVVFWLHLLSRVSTFRDRGVPKPTSECRRVPQPRWVDARPSAKGEVRWPETGVREVGIPRPSCSSRTQVGCACSRGLQASTREREQAASSERLSRPRPRAANPL
jgi:hypothetical protein